MACYDRFSYFCLLLRCQPQMCPFLEATFLRFQGTVSLSLIRRPYFANAILPYSGYFLNLFPGFPHLFEAYDLTAYLREFSAIQFS